MGVTIYGDQSGDNYHAAQELKPALEGLLQFPENEARIVASAYTPGCAVQDTDLLVLGILRKPVDVPRHLLPEPLRVRPCKISNFALAIELKSHTPNAVRFEGNQVLVRYRNRVTRQDEWHGATDQSHKQVHALREYVNRHRLQPPWFMASIWLRNVPKTQLPQSLHNLLGAGVAPIDLMRLLVGLSVNKLTRNLSKPWRASYVSCCRDDAAKELSSAMDLFTRSIEPSPLDRKKIERITRTTLKDEVPQYIERMGTQLLAFHGRGGSGKTVRLLQLANHLQGERGARVLLLTYNRALAADLRRLLRLMGIREHFDDPTISIGTSEKFFWTLMKAWGLAPEVSPGEEFPEAEYATAKSDLRDLLKGETRESLQGEAAWTENPSILNWDIVMVDEAQDWPSEERDILASIFGPERLVVADGVDQLVRRDGRCDWVGLVSPEKRQIVSLRKSLRLKSNLCRFVESYADHAGLEWDLRINDDVAGGRIILVPHRYSREVHDEIMASHVESGNTPIDSLFCVTAGAGAESGHLSNTLGSWGYRCWNGADSSTRDSYPDSVDQFRIVKYESCRGLEGWTVVCLDFEVFVRRQYEQGLLHPHDLYETAEEHANRFATRWALIPMTRAIDTLVLQYSPDSSLASVLSDLARSRDYIEVRRPM